MKTRILFVDDEARVLDGLRRMLRGMRHEWDMTFVDCGARALEVLRAETVDVVVTDMRMPQMDGAALLREVKEISPGAVRIVLSGYAERETTNKALGTAHQYLAKPTDAETVKGVIGRACALRDLLASEALKELVSRIQTLPSVPVVYNRIVELLGQPDCSARDIGEVIAEDLGMTAKILQIVNSAFFGLPRRFTDVSQAVAYLGTDTIRGLVLSSGVFSQFSNKGRSGLNPDTLFQHCQSVGVSARKICAAEKMPKDIADDAFMAGLLHDIGKLIIADRFADAFRDIGERSIAEGCYFHEMEDKVLGASHAELGAYLMGLWGLPDGIVEAIGYHHRPGECHDAKLGVAGIVHAADGLSWEQLGSESSTGHEPLDQAYFERLGLSDRLGVWRQAIQQ